MRTLNQGQLESGAELEPGADDLKDLSEAYGLPEVDTKKLIQIHMGSYPNIQHVTSYDRLPVDIRLHTLALMPVRVFLVFGFVVAFYTGSDWCRG